MKASEPNAIARKTTLSSGIETAFVPRTRNVSGTRPRIQAPSPLSIVSETAKAARLASTILHVPARKPKALGTAAGIASTTAIQTARMADAAKPIAIMTCAFRQPSRRVGAVWCAISISASARPIRYVPPGAARSLNGSSTILFAPICAERTTPTYRPVRMARRRFTE